MPGVSDDGAPVEKQPVLKAAGLQCMGVAGLPGPGTLRLCSRGLLSLQVNTGVMQREAETPNCYTSELATVTPFSRSAYWEMHLNSPASSTPLKLTSDSENCLELLF